MIILLEFNSGNLISHEASHRHVPQPYWAPFMCHPSLWEIKSGEGFRNIFHIRRRNVVKVYVQNRFGEEIRDFHKGP